MDQLSESVVESVADSAKFIFCLPLIMCVGVGMKSLFIYLLAEKEEVERTQKIQRDASCEY